MNKDFWTTLDILVANSQRVIDRPRGSHHPKYADHVYPVDYGYLFNTASMDGSGIDLWQGSSTQQTLDAIICTVDLVKRDSEIKLLIGCTDSERDQILAFHNVSENMKGILIQRKVNEK